MGLMYIIIFRRRLEEEDKERIRAHQEAQEQQEELEEAQAQQQAQNENGKDIFLDIFFIFVSFYVIFCIEIDDDDAESENDGQEPMDIDNEPMGIDHAQNLGNPHDSCMVYVFLMWYVCFIFRFYAFIICFVIHDLFLMFLWPVAEYDRSFPSLNNSSRNDLEEQLARIQGLRRQHRDYLSPQRSTARARMHQTHQKTDHISLKIDHITSNTSKTSYFIKNIKNIIYHKKTPQNRSYKTCL